MRSTLLLFYFCTLLLPGAALGAIAHETSTESHTGTTGNTSSASFDISVPFTSSSRGLLVFTYNANSNANDATSVKIAPTGANTDVPAVTGGLAVDTAGEAGSCRAWFVGSGLPTTTTTVRVNRNNNANIMYAVAITVTGSTASTFVAGTPVLQQGDGAIAESAVESGTATAIRYACGYNGGNSPATAGASSTLLQSIDFGSFGAAAARETTPGTGSRSAGLSVGSDDRAAVTLALAELQACSGTTWTTGTDNGINAVGGSDSGTLTLYNTPTNSFIAVSTALFSGSGVSTIAVSDNINGAYTQSFYRTNTVDGGVALHYLPNNTTGGTITITANPAGASADMTIAAHTFCGGHATPASGTPVTATTTGVGNSATPATGAMTPADDDVLVVAATGPNPAVATTIIENAGGEGFTLSNERESPTYISLVYKIISGAPGTPSESWTLQNSEAWNAGIAAFKPAGAGAPPATPAATGRRRIQ